MRLTFLATTVLFLGVFAVSACGEPRPAKTSEASRTPAAIPAEQRGGAAAPVTKTTSLKRSQVKQTISKGVGYFLQNVAVEDYPAMKANKFYGWKVRSVNAALGVDIQPGDVVLKVNGMPIEHPEEADAALRSLEKVATVRVDFERNGKLEALELPITEE